MKGKISKIFIGILLLLSAVALVVYGIGYEAAIFQIPIYKLLIGAVIVAWIISKICFGSTLRERLKIFLPLAFLFMVFEKEIAAWANLPNENIINNWLVILAALLANIAVIFIFPKKVLKNHSMRFGRQNHIQDAFESNDTNSFSSNTVYIDAASIKKSYVKNSFGETTVYYQNTDLITENENLELNINNSFGETDVHIPADWVVTNQMHCVLGEVNTRKNTGNGVRLTITGNSKFGETNISSP